MGVIRCFLISEPKHMLRVLKIINLRYSSFKCPKHLFNFKDKKIIAILCKCVLLQC